MVIYFYNCIRIRVGYDVCNDIYENAIVLADELKIKETRND